MTTPSTPPGRWQIDRADGSARIDLAEVDGDDPAEVLAIVDGLRGLARAGLRVVVDACPQMVAHTLYKAGILGAPWLEVTGVRDEEPYG